MIYILLLAAVLLFVYLFVGRTTPADKISWGVDFSKEYAEGFGLNWKDVYLGILDDLGVKHIKLAAQWDLIEPKKDKYDFNDLDFEVREAEERNVGLIMVLGIKTPRWPECHVPGWASSMSPEERDGEVLKAMGVVVKRYKNSPAVTMWQVENEPFFPFGNCLARSDGYLEREIALVKGLDAGRKVLISDTGEWSLWFRAAKAGDIVGATLYRRAWFGPLKEYVSYPFTPVYYARRALLIKWFFGKDVINIEYQAEPWSNISVKDLSPEERDKTMTHDLFKSDIEFAKKTGFNEFYFWGVEWWYWVKTKQGDGFYWDEARNIIKGNQ